VCCVDFSRRPADAGRPLGAEDFVSRMERKLGRKWRRWSFEQAQESAMMA